VTAVETIADDLWAETIASRFEATVETGHRICLATGNTPTPFYAAVAQRMALDGLTIFLLDEFGGLPAGDPGRCVSMITRDLLDRAAGAPAVHVPDVDTPEPDTAAERYGGIIAEGGLDLAIVGLGANGHIGMNEPGTTSDQGTRFVTLDPSTSAGALAYGATIPPAWGITVGISELLDAREIWVLATGEHKRDILNHTLHGAVDSDVPATFLTEHPNCTFFVDDSAAFTG